MITPKQVGSVLGAVIGVGFTAVVVMLFVWALVAVWGQIRGGC